MTSDVVISQAMLSPLEGVKSNGSDRYTFHCPLSHRKKDARAEIWLDDNGKIAIVCYDCQRNQELWEHVVRPHLPERSETQEWTYDHTDGSVRIVYRQGNGKDKRIWQSGGPLLGTKVKIWPAQYDRVITWAEGEKAAGAIQSIGYAAASSIGGAGNVDKSDYSALKGCNLLVWPDDDDEGRKAAQKVAQAAVEAGAQNVRIAETVGANNGADAADLFPDARRARLIELIAKSKDYVVAPTHMNGSAPTGDTVPDGGLPLTNYTVSFDIDLDSAPLPAILSRSDGETILYAGKLNWLYGEPGSGKSWVALMAVQDTVQRGGRVLYWDHEDSINTFVKRGMVLGFDSRKYDGEVKYVLPAMIESANAMQEAIDFLVDSETPSLVVIDTAESAGCPSDGASVEQWMESYIMPWRAHDIGVIVVDHVPKSRDNRPRGPIGSQHKMAKVDGSAIAVGGLPWTRRTNGKLILVNEKDRQGDLPVPNGKTVAEIPGVWDDHGILQWSLAAPDIDDENIASEVLNALDEAGEDGIKGLASLRNMVRGKTSKIDAALDILSQSGHLTISKFGNSNHYRITDSGRAILQSGN